MATSVEVGKYIFGIGSKTIGVLDEAKSAFSGENQPIEELVAATIKEAVDALNGAKVEDVNVTLFKKGIALSVMAVAKGVKNNEP